MNLRLLVISLLLISGFYSAQVGVNTTTPTETLDVNGSLRVRKINQIGPDQSAKDSIMVFDSDGVVKYVSANKVVSQATAGSSKVLTNSTLIGNGSTGNELGLAQQGATSGQVLAWNGTTWLPVNASGLSTTVSNTSTGNVLSTTVNGTTGATVPIINSNVISITAGVLKTSVNGVESTVTLPVSDGSDTKVTAGTGAVTVTGTGTTADPYKVNNTFTEIDGSITNEVNTALSSAVNTLSITDSNGTLTAPMVNSVANNITAGQLTTTVNGVAGAAIILPVSDGSDTKVEAGTGAVTVTGTGTTADPYKVNNTFTEIDGSITNEVNTALSSAVNTLSITDSNGTLTAPMVNSVANNITAGQLTTTVNGVAGAAITLPVSDGSDTKVTAAGINTISGNGTTATPYIITGTEIDGSITNEIQTLSISGDNLTISGSGGNTVTLPTNVLTNSTLIGNGSTGNELGLAQQGATSGQVLAWNGTTWLPVNAAVPVSSLTPAIATNTIDNTNFAQTWNWSTATSQTPLTLSGNTLTTGNLLSLAGAGTLTSGSLINAVAQVGATTTKGLLNIQNTAASGTGTVATIQANSTAGSGVNVYANGNVGVNTTTPAFTVATNTTATAPTLGVDGTTNSTNYTSTYLNLGNSGSSFTWNQNAGSTASVTLTANSTLIITNAKMGMYGLIIVKQDAAGNKTLTLPAGSKVINGGAGVLELTGVGNAADMLSYFYDGTNYWWTVGYNYN